MMPYSISCDGPHFTLSKEESAEARSGEKAMHSLCLLFCCAQYA